MPFYRPNVAKIIERRIGDFEYELGSQSARIKGTVEHALAKSGSGAAHGQHGHLDDVSKNAFPHLADDERLRQWASFYGLFQQEAVRASGYVAFSLSGGVDTNMPAGTIAVRPDGSEYEVLEDTLIPIGGAGVLFRARVAGAAGNMPGGTTLTLQSPIVGIQSEGTVIFDFFDGLEPETSAALRTRLLERIQKPPKGGGPGDYIAWAKLIPGVTRAWEFPWTPKVGNVTVLFMRDLDVDPFPGFVAVNAMAAHLATFAPICAPAPIVQAPVKLPISLDISLTLAPGAVLLDVQAAIYKSIQDMLATKFEPSNIDSTLYLSWITEAISTTPGELDHTLVLPLVGIYVAPWEIPVLEAGGINWV